MLAIVLMRNAISHSRRQGQTNWMTVIGVAALFFVYMSSAFLLKGVEGAAAGLMPILPGILLFTIGVVID